MHFSITVALAAFPFLVGAVPAHNSRDNLLSIPLSKRWLSRSSDNGSAPGNISLTAINPTFLWSGTIQVGTPSKEYSGRSLFRGSTAVETDHFVCSRLRHSVRRFVAVWPFLSDLPRTRYLRSLPEFLRERPEDAI